jgi:hypothetical protein
MPEHAGCARHDAILKSAVAACDGHVFEMLVGEPFAGYSLDALRVSGDGFQEVVALEGVELHARARGDGRGTGDVAEQGDLTEEVARTERSHVAAFFGHSNLAVRETQQPRRPR